MDPTQPETNVPARIGLVLPGGGARAAYQVGVLCGLAELLPADAATPFRVIAGTSAGAINAAMMASHARDFRAGVAHLERLWRGIRSDQVFHTGPLIALRTGLRWLLALAAGTLKRHQPMTLLDNAPLRRLLRANIDFARMRQAIDTPVRSTHWRSRRPATRPHARFRSTRARERLPPGSARAGSANAHKSTSSTSWLRLRCPSFSRRCASDRNSSATVHCARCRR